MPRDRRRRALCRGVIAGLAMSGLLAGAGADRSLAAAPAQTVEELEASVVMTFARFVEWSPDEFASAAAPIVVGVIADEAVALALEILARGKRVAGRALAVTRLRWDSDLAGVHMLIVGDAEKRHLAIVLARIGARRIVTVSRLSGFGRGGGMITLSFVDGRISFAVNSRATALAAVRLSSFMLSHATKVSDESAGAAP